MCDVVPEDECPKCKRAHQALRLKHKLIGALEKENLELRAQLALFKHDDAGAKVTLSRQQQDDIIDTFDLVAAE